MRNSRLVRCWDLLGARPPRLPAPHGKTCLLIPVGIGGWWVAQGDSDGLWGGMDTQELLPIPGCCSSGQAAVPGELPRSRVPCIAMLKAVFFPLAARQIGHKCSPWSLLVFFCVGTCFNIFEM